MVADSSVCNLDYIIEKDPIINRFLPGDRGNYEMLPGQYL